MNYLLGLTGYPLAHSLSPRIHTAALRALGLEGEYRLYPIPPRAERRPRAEREAAVEAPVSGSASAVNTLSALLGRLREGVLHGLNVTIPHKQAVIPLLDDLTDAARAIGAVNTIFVQDGCLIGDNTDAPGFWADLTRFLAEIGRASGGSALVLGAGGAARAVAYALLTHGYEVFVAARRLEQAADLCESLSRPPTAVRRPPTTDHRPLSAVRGRIHPLRLFRIPHSAFRLVVNATPLGMSPHVDTSPWPADLPFPSDAAVYDLVYNPAETLLVRQARSAGLPAITGLGMLVEQAALAFERWTGLPAPRAAMHAAA